NMLFAWDIKASNYEHYLEIANKGGFKAVLFLQGYGIEHTSDTLVPTDHYENLAELQSIIQEFKNNGIICGVHCLPNPIGINHPNTGTFFTRQNGGSYDLSGMVEWFVGASL